MRSYVYEESGLSYPEKRLRMWCIISVVAFLLSLAIFGDHNAPRSTPAFDRQTDAMYANERGNVTETQIVRGE